MDIVSKSIASATLFFLNLYTVYRVTTIASKTIIPKPPIDCYSNYIWRKIEFRLQKSLNPYNLLLHFKFCKLFVYISNTHMLTRDKYKNNKVE